MTSRHATAGLTVAAALLILAGCGSAGTSPTGAAQATSGGADSPTDAAPSGTSASPGASASGPVTGHVGDKLSFAELGGDKVDVTLVKVFDPAVPTDPNGAAPKGQRWIGLEAVIDNHSPDIGGELALFYGLTSDGQHISPYDLGESIDPFPGCTDTSDSADTDKPYTSCKGFLVPDGVTVKAVAARVGGAEIASGPDQATWTVP